MPKPVYILCAESGSEDKTSGLVSHFNVLEQIELQSVPKFEPGSGMIPVVLAKAFVVVATWMREDTDLPTDEFECETVFHQPDGNQVIVATKRFDFEKPRFRLTVRASGMIFQQPGAFIAESRVRKLGREPGPWVSQSYPLQLILLETEPPAAQGNAEP